jgi:anti-anti-sigma factor
MTTFEATLTSDGTTALLTLAGELDADSAPSFFDRVHAAAAQEPARLVLDVGRLNYLSSAGLRGLAFARQKMPPDVEIVVVGASGRVLETIRLTGFDRSVVFRDGWPG